MPPTWQRMAVRSTWVAKWSRGQRRAGADSEGVFGQATEGGGGELDLLGLGESREAVGPLQAGVVKVDELKGGVEVVGDLRREIDAIEGEAADAGEVGGGMFEEQEPGEELVFGDAGGGGTGLVGAGKTVPGLAQGLVEAIGALGGGEEADREDKPEDQCQEEDHLGEPELGALGGGRKRHGQRFRRGSAAGRAVEGRRPHPPGRRGGGGTAGGGSGLPAISIAMPKTRLETATFGGTPVAAAFGRQGVDALEEDLGFEVGDEVAEDAAEAFAFVGGADLDDELARGPRGRW
ncbi:MAG: hypothetical protein M5U12_22350 [Verrucomicrobia bacterium]|nr:hypothetical protein [Verrucomicrobiota bacterium]